MHLPDLPFLILDTETTGFVPKKHRVIEVACVRMEHGEKVAELSELLALPEGTEIPKSIQMLTHITPEDLVGRRTFMDILPALQSLLTPETIIVGQNVQFDLGMLRGEGWDLTDRPWIDTSMLASLVFPELRSFSLGFMSDALRLDHTPRHRALGDVRATVQILEWCTDRLSKLTSSDLQILTKIAMQGPVGYRQFFAALQTRATKRPSWLQRKRPKTTTSANFAPVPTWLASEPPAHHVRLVEEPVDPGFTEAILQHLGAMQWLSVKNLEHTVRRNDVPQRVNVLHPPEFVLSRTKVKKLIAQPTLTADEMTLLMKLALYEPKVRTDVPLHGGEYQVWAGKLACSRQDAEYCDLLAASLKGSALVSHQHLLELSGAADVVLPEDLGVIIDDASMLEDAVTQALEWSCFVPTLRAAAQGNEELMQCVDIIELWTERIRGGLDLKYLTPVDLESRESIALRSTISGIANSLLPDAVATGLQNLLLILDRQNLDGRITWIETKIDGVKAVKSVPELIAPVLRQRLFSRIRSTLLIPPASAEHLSIVLDDSIETTLVPSAATSTLRIDFPLQENIESILRVREGKTILLVPSKRTIEDIYVRFGPVFEHDGATLLCQGFAGGQGRMQAEFEQARAPAFLVMTPWMYEGVELPPLTIDRLVLQVLPFDHPAHAVGSRRSLRCRNAFGDYALPRLKQRLFRLLRTFARHATVSGTVMVLDDRLRTKGYGKEVREYLQKLGRGSIVSRSAVASDEQMRLL